MIKIKTLLIVIALLTGFILPATAQIGEPRDNFAIGFNGGVNLNTVSFQPKIKQQSMMSPIGGFTLRYISEKYFAMICGLQVEMNYAQRGWNELFEIAGENGDPVKDPTRIYKRSMNYIEIPFLAHLAFGKDTGVQFFANLGPQVAFLLSDSEEKTGEWEKWTLSETQNAIYGKKIENKFDYGITGGVGLEIRTRKIGHFLVEGRYYYALSDFMNTSKKDYFGRAAHATISARITYLFDLKK